MPANATYKQETRKQPDVYEIRKNNYSPQFEVSARTTDHFMGVGEDGDAKSLIETLKTFQQGVGNYSTLQDLQRKDNKKQAELDAANGVYNKPTNILNLGGGYDEAHGEVNMTTARLKAQEELKANNFFGGDQAKIKEVVDKHYQSSGIDFNNNQQMLGAASQYQVLQDFAAAGGVAADFERKKTQHYNDIGKIATNLLTEYRQITDGKPDHTILRQQFANLRHSMDTTLIHPEKQAEVAADAIMSATNQRVNDLIKEGKLDEAEEFKNDIISALRLPDKDGVVWTMLRNKEGINAIGDQVDKYDSHFTKLIYDEEQKIERDNQKTYKDNSAQYMSDMLLEKDSSKLQGYYATLKKAYADNELDSEHYAQTVEFLNRVRQTDLNVIENAKDATAFLANVFQGRAKISEVYKMVADGRIRRDTAEKAIGMLERLKAHADSLAMQQDGFNKQLWWNSYEKGFSSLALTFKKDAEDNPAAWNVVTDTYNDLVLNKKMSPLEAKAEVIKKYTTNEGVPTFFTPYATEAQAKAEYQKASSAYRSGKMSKRDYDIVVRNAEVFMRRSSYTGYAPEEPLPPKKK